MEGSQTSQEEEEDSSTSGIGSGFSNSSSSSSGSGTTRNSQHHVLSIAPMIQWTDRHYRHLMRSLTKKTQLFTEMVMDDAIYFNRQDLEAFIGFDRDLEPPIALQIGGSTPELCGEAAYCGEEYGYNEINLNAGCPSAKAKCKGFGAELMLSPSLTREICHSMIRMTSQAEITVKCRLGVTGRDSYAELLEFVEAVRSTGVRKMYLHARKCELKGLSPAQNRTVPPLNYSWIHALVAQYPDMKFTLNGGVLTLNEAEKHLHGRDGGGDNEGEGKDDDFYPRTTFRSDTSTVSTTPPHGVMIGRGAYNNPWQFADADRRFFGCKNPGLSRREIVEEYIEYANKMNVTGMHGTSIPFLMKPLHNFFTGCPQAENKAYKRKLNGLLEQYCKTKSSFDDIIWEAIDNTISEDELDRRVL